MLSHLVDYGIMGLCKKIRGGVHQKNIIGLEKQLGLPYFPLKHLI
jgi:hypothetical protein